MLRKEEKAADKKTIKKEKSGSTKDTPEKVIASSDVINHVETMLTEKSMHAQEKNVVVFRVHPKASKGQIATAIEAKYGVKPISVRTMRVRPKMRRRGMTIGFTKKWKKAYVQVKDVSKFNE